MSFRELHRISPYQAESTHNRLVQQEETQITTEKRPAIVKFTSLNKNDVRGLLARWKNQHWEQKDDVRGTIVTRDMLEYTAVRNMAAVLQEISDKLADIEVGGGVRTPDNGQKIYLMK